VLTEVIGTLLQITVRYAYGCPLFRYLLTTEIKAVLAEITLMTMMTRMTMMATVTNQMTLSADVYNGIHGIVGLGTPGPPLPPPRLPGGNQDNDVVNSSDS